MFVLSLVAGYGLEQSFFELEKVTDYTQEIPTRPVIAKIRGPKWLEAEARATEDQPREVFFTTKKEATDGQGYGAKWHSPERDSFNWRFRNFRQWSAP